MQVKAKQIMQQDCHRISATVIEAVRQHPVLYINDVKGCGMKLQVFRQKVWDRISDELNLDGNIKTQLRFLLILSKYLRMSKTNQITNLYNFYSRLGEIKVEKFEGHLLPNIKVQEQT